jgi:hypothetical protein
MLHDVAHGLAVAVERGHKPLLRLHDGLAVDPSNVAAWESELNEIRNLLRASRTGSMSFFAGSGSMPCASKRVRNKGTSKFWPLCATQMSYWLSSATMAATTALSSEQRESRKHEISKKNQQTAFRVFVFSCFRD